MNDFNTENLNAQIEDNMIRLTVNGPVAQEETNAALEWFNQIGQEQGEYDLYLEIPKMNFEGLGDVRKTFLNLAHIMRGMENCNKCAVVTDSAFLRSTAQIESAALPNMELGSFGIVDLAEAENWLDKSAA